MDCLKNKGLECLVWNQNVKYVSFFVNKALKEKVFIFISIKLLTELTTIIKTTGMII